MWSTQIISALFMTLIPLLLLLFAFVGVVFLQRRKTSNVPNTLCANDNRVNVYTSMYIYSQIKFQTLLQNTNDITIKKEAPFLE